jgi:lipopolysaccharide/colanic/teichoic acid biosynthesis glycosyltransferase
MDLAMKRLLDVALSCLAGVVLLPLMLAIAVIVLTDSGPPVFFRPERVGRGFTAFRQYKFRSMVKDAQARLPQLAHLNVAPGMIKIPNDPRVTRVGRWLRRLSLDELPQLVNVIRGDMSLVGPRPYAADEVSAGDAADRELFTMRPGLTGLWQISSRTDPSIEKRRQLDLEYVRKFSVGLDLQIMLATIPIVLLGRGGQVAVNK